MILLKNICSYQTLKYSQTFQLKLMASLRKLTVSRFFRLSLTDYQKKSTGDLMLIMNKHSGQTALILEDIRFFLGQIFYLLISLYLLSTISKKLTLFAFFFLLLFYYPSRWIYKRMDTLGEDTLKDAKNISIFGIELISAFRLIKESANEENEMKRYDGYLDNFNKTQLKTGLAREAIRISNETLSILCLILLVIAWFLLNRQGNHSVSHADFIAFLVLYQRTIGPLTTLVTQGGMFANRLAGARDLSSFLDETDRARVPEGHKIFSAFKQKLEFKNITFSYRTGDIKALNNISFELKQGENIALVGESGAGKSTVLSLIYGFNTANQGDLLVDGVPLKDLDMKSWRKKIACVSQDTFLFNKSIRENILYGLDTPDEKQYQKALDTANARTFIEELENKDQTLIGERGVRLSGGQAQRIAIARAIVKNPEILILDEATSSLDSLAEKQIQQSLEKLSHSFTTLIIAHRLSTIVHCDKIIVLEKGTIIEEGTHVELLEMRGKYAKMWEAQIHHH
jgi:ABC-type multidrug transport system fused ATPase/permease subunit